MEWASGQDEREMSHRHMCDTLFGSFSPVSYKRACVWMCSRADKVKTRKSRLLFFFPSSSSVYDSPAVTWPYIIEHPRTLFQSVNFLAGQGWTADTPPSLSRGLARSLMRTLFYSGVCVCSFISSDCTYFLIQSQRYPSKKSFNVV